MPKAAQHKRENDILLGFLERPALNWLAAHSPSWVTPDLLTWTGVFASVLIFVSYGLTQVHRGFFWLASFGFVLNWLGDSLDGTLARYRHVERPRYGFLIDHSVDAISVVLIFVGLGLTPHVNLVAAMMAAIGYLLVSIMVYLVTYVTGVFQITSAKIGPTEIRVLGIVLNTVMFFTEISTPFNLPYFGPSSAYTLATLILALALVVYFLINTGIQLRRLALLDGKRLERKLEKSKKESRKNAAPQQAPSKP